jgi:hypothetical protein
MRSWACAPVITNLPKVYNQDKHHYKKKKTNSYITIMKPPKKSTSCHGITPAKKGARTEEAGRRQPNQDQAMLQTH